MTISLPAGALSPVGRARGAPTKAPALRSTRADALNPFGSFSDACGQVLEFLSDALPMEIWGMTTNVTSPALYALGTVTTLVSFVVIALSLGSIAIIQWRRSRRPIAQDAAVPANGDAG